MTLDRACGLFCLALLPILILPPQWLGLGWLVGLCFCLFVPRHWLYAVVGLLVMVSYHNVHQLRTFAESVQANKRSEKVAILHILKQQDYQRAIAQNTQGERFYLNWQSDTLLVLNGRYQIDAKIRPISARLNEGNFDRQRWLFAQRLTHLATVKKADYLGQNVTLRTQWLNCVTHQTADLSHQGVLLALAFGERAWLNGESWKKFQQSATAHLIAISGLHIALAFGVGFWLAKLGQWGILRIFPSNLYGLSYRLPLVVGWLLALGYSFLAGFSVPTLRAVVAISLVLACRFSRRHYTPWQMWLRCVALLLGIEPLNLISDSFWLSILSVVGLIFWYQHFPLSLIDGVLQKKQP
ncbi:hypothetical protein A4G19_14710 [Pasteurellaceae bacterium Macca]|nr:hypothetical protein [Pasteurellaceae bacterium Macca]